MLITHEVLYRIIGERISDDCIIYLSGPSSLDTPLDIMRSKNCICVNGSAGYLVNNNIPVFIYVVCDGSFYENNKELFYKYCTYAQHTFISEDVVKRADMTEKENLLSTCFLLKDICKSRGGIGRKIRYKIKSFANKNLKIKCSAFRKVKTIAFSTDVTYGHFGSATVAFSALQIAISLKFERIIFSGLDLNGSCKRFYNEINTQPTTLPADFEFILKSFSFVSSNYDGKIFNLSSQTAIPYDVIPFISTEEAACFSIHS
ncbi:MULTISPECIES: 3-deoxy-D-manno-oct-2-ulosonate III transferase WaaZ [Citrobacter]|jgi:KDO transferase-3|uniref:3-deoxy-D-manno-oct-2-ulosonate III transferase WaaZ n=1 Tax=Citrobacter TaxID=544 RepID=UPI000A45591C|nr:MULTISPECIES: 3-deoxy-D-manno-oct-2-ulosonate III transferase WaaZ [unclassified Citrobacter]MDM2742682.1 3-deoxy-D-manno-oct-2-ulosonate III transferase WaaZ [Citrobacter sp. Cu096]MDM2744982.1 3-deoxy-D-manno-oct-2-ulosonate III transferase WaaZ [Citrobacter sp. Cu231]HCW0178587.1 3-deoxy-D-manno-oct-2-ulosonate III transferase WaaZ [Citrobacter freundii]